MVVCDVVFTKHLNNVVTKHKIQLLLYNEQFIKYSLWNKLKVVSSQAI